MLGFRSHNVCEDSRAGKRRDKTRKKPAVWRRVENGVHEIKISREYCPALCIGIGHISHRWNAFNNWSHSCTLVLSLFEISQAPFQTSTCEWRFKMFSCLLSEVRMSDGALPWHWSSTPGQQVFELANSFIPDWSSCNFSVTVPISKCTPAFLKVLK